MTARMTRRITGLLALALLPGAALAADAPDYFQNAIGARPGAMGNAFVAVANDVNGIYFNPAGTVNVPRSQFTFMRHGFDTLDVETNHIGYLYKLDEDTAVGLSYMLETNDNNFFTTYQGVGAGQRPQRGGSFEEKETGLMLSYGRRMSEYSSFGATARYFRQTLPGFSEAGFGLDAGLLYQQTANFSLGVNFQNIIPTDIGEDRIPFNAKVGAAYKTLDGNMLVAADVNTNPGGDDDATFNLGVEYRIIPELALRAGAEDDDYTLGLGLSFDEWQLDYAYMDKEIGNVSRIGFNYFPDVGGPRQKATARGPVVRQPVGDVNVVAITRDIAKPKGKEMGTDVRIVRPGEAIVNLGQIDKLATGDKLAVLLKGKVSAMITITDAGRFFSQAQITEKGYEGSLVKGTLLGDAILLVK